MHAPFSESETTSTLQAQVREFALESIVPVARELDETARFPWDNVKAMAERGWFGVPVPREFSGMGRDYLSYILVVEELARHDASHAITVSAHTTLATSPILAFGTEAQRARFLPWLASGQVLGGFGLTEPGAGSDSSGTRTRAVRRPRRIPDQRQQDLHHPRRGGGDLRGYRGDPSPGQGSRGITSFIVCKPTTDLADAERVGIGHRPRLPYSEGDHPRRRRKTSWGGARRTPGSSSCRRPSWPRTSGSAKRGRASGIS